MSLSVGWQDIDTDTVRENVQKYTDFVPPALKDLEEFRGNTIQKVLQERKENGEAFLEKDELLKLVEWKL